MTLLTCTPVVLVRLKCPGVCYHTETLQRGALPRRVPFTVQL